MKKLGIKDGKKGMREGDGEESKERVNGSTVRQMA